MTLLRLALRSLLTRLGLAGSTGGASAVTSRLKPPAVPQGEPLKPFPVIRVWKLGSLEHRIFPTEAAIQKLADCLTADGMTDLIWGPELTVEWLPAHDGVNVVAGPDIRFRQVDDQTIVVEKVEPPSPDPTDTDEAVHRAILHNIVMD